MKIQLFYDLLKSCPSGDHSKAEKVIGCSRFVKQVSMPVLLVGGQTYSREYDPVNDNSGPNDFTVASSGIFEDGDRNIPFIIIEDDWEFDFNSWFESCCSREESQLPFAKLLDLWLKENDRKLPIIRERFLSDGWKEFITTWEGGEQTMRGPKLPIGRTT